MSKVLDTPSDSTTKKPLLPNVDSLCSRLSWCKIESGPRSFHLHTEPLTYWWKSPTYWWFPPRLSFPLHNLNKGMFSRVQSKILQKQICLVWWPDICVWRSFLDENHHRLLTLRENRKKNLRSYGVTPKIVGWHTNHITSGVLLSIITDETSNYVRELDLVTTRVSSESHL